MNNNIKTMKLTYLRVRVWIDREPQVYSFKCGANLAVDNEEDMKLAEEYAQKIGENTLYYYSKQTDKNDTWEQYAMETLPHKGLYMLLPQVPEGHIYYNEHDWKGMLEEHRKLSEGE